MKRIGIIGVCLVAALAMSMVAAASAAASVTFWGSGIATPEEVSGLNEAVAVSAGGPDLALLSSGKVMAWRGTFLGNGTGPNSGTVTVCAVGTVGTCLGGPYLEEVTAVSSNAEDSLALLKSTEVIAWGPDSDGELGNGTTANGSNVPVRVCAVGTVGTCPGGPYLKEVVAVSASDAGSLALLKNGTVVAWGRNVSGELGDGTNTGPEVCPTTDPCSITPVEVSGLIEVVAIASGRFHNLAVLKNGEVMAWGWGSGGQLGDGTTASSDVPVAVCAVGTVGTCSGGPYLGGAVAVAGALGQSVVLLSNHTVVDFGENEYGELGNGTLNNTEVPVEVSGLIEAVSVSAGVDVSMATLKDGTVRTWGNNGGELGNGETTTGPELCYGTIACSTKPVEVCAVGTTGPCPIGPYLSGVTDLSGDSGSAGLGSLAVAALPGPHWFKNALEIKKGKLPTKVRTEGLLVLHALNGTITCKVTDKEEIWNPLGLGRGEDRVTVFKTSCNSEGIGCVGPKVTKVIPLGLPWSSHLVGGAPVRDNIEQVKLEVKCGATSLAVFEGTLTPEVGAGVLNFGAGSGTLFDGAKEASFTGQDKLIVGTSVITAK